MTNIMIKENIQIEDIVYEIKGKQVMLDSEISISKCHNHLCYKMITYNDIVKTIFNNSVM